MPRETAIVVAKALSIPKLARWGGETTRHPRRVLCSGPTLLIVCAQVLASGSPWWSSIGASRAPGTGLLSTVPDHLPLPQLGHGGRFLVEPISSSSLQSVHIDVPADASLPAGTGSAIARLL